MKRIILILILILISCSISSGYVKDAIEVTKVIDGDTLVLSYGTKVRLLGVDTPELHHPSKPVQCYAEEAKKFTELQVLNKPVKLTFEGPSTDKYGRTLAWVWYGPSYSILLNSEIIRKGYGFSYRKYPTSKLALLNKLEQEARTKQLGLWNPQNCPQK